MTTHVGIGTRVLIDAADLDLPYRGRIPCKVTGRTNFHTQVQPETGEPCQNIPHDWIVGTLKPGEAFEEDPVVTNKYTRDSTLANGWAWRQNHKANA